MEVFLLIAAIILTVWLLPYIRIFLKRITMSRKLRGFCKSKGYLLHPTHRLWMLGRRAGKSCDFYVETPDTVYTVKLFGIKKRGRYLIFTPDGSFRERRFLNLLSYGRSARIAQDDKPRTLPGYNFRVGFQDRWYLKSIRPILLLNPTCMEVRVSTVGGEKIVGNSETIGGISIYTLSGFLGELERME